MENKIYNQDDLPKFQTFRKGAKKKYPWFGLKPGQGFKFDIGVSLAGARSQVAAAARAEPPDGEPRKFIVRVDEGHVLWCIRIDGLPVSVRDEWLRARAPTPVQGQDIDGEQFAGMRETGPYEISVQDGDFGTSAMVDPIEPRIEDEPGKEEII